MYRFSSDYGTLIINITASTISLTEKSYNTITYCYCKYFEDDEAGIRILKTARCSITLHTTSQQDH